MREIKLFIQKEEDLVLLMQGINWIRQYSIKATHDLFVLMDKMDEEQKAIFKTTITEQVDTYDRLMILLAQLDNLLEKKKHSKKKLSKREKYENN